jgi:hypothetical protein
VVERWSLQCAKTSESSAVRFSPIANTHATIVFDDHVLTRRPTCLPILEGHVRLCGQFTKGAVVRHGTVKYSAIVFRPEFDRNMS